MLNGLNQLRGLSQLRTNAGGFNIASLFAGGKLGFALDFTNAAQLYTDNTLATPFGSAYGPLLGGIKDLSPNAMHFGQATTTKMPNWSKRPSTALRNMAIGCGDVAGGTYWLPTWLQNGITATKIGSGVDVDSLPYADYQFIGTATSTFHATIYNNNSSRTVSNTTDTWTASLICRQIAGSLTGVTGLQVVVAEETNPSTLIGSTNGNLVTASTDTVSAATRTFTTGNQSRLGVSLTFSNGATIDVTYRIKGLQLELAASRSNTQWSKSAYEWYELGFTSAAMACADGIDDNLRSIAQANWGGATQFTMAASGMKFSDAARGLAMEIAGTNAGLYAPNGAAANVAAAVNTGGGSVSNIRSGIASPIGFTMLAQTDFAAGTVVMSVNGLAPTTQSGTGGAGTLTLSFLDLLSRAGTAVQGNMGISRAFARMGTMTLAETAALQAWINTVGV